MTNTKTSKASKTSVTSKVSKSAKSTVTKPSAKLIASEDEPTVNFESSQSGNADLPLKSSPDASDEEKHAPTEETPNKTFSELVSLFSSSD
jgi:hypothetical protein